MLKKVICVLILAVLLPLAAFAESTANEAQLQWISVPFVTLARRNALEWSFPYSDALFDAPATAYNHTLAQSTLGLAVSAFRQKNRPLAEKDAAVKDYLTEAGFMNLQSEQYDITPSADTVATMIGSKRIGDATLVAIAVSGGDYEKEWQSNFTICAQQYDDSRAFHDGFAGAAAKVLARISLYLSEQKIEGPVKFWLTGYSRAAAVSNITAYELLSNGLTDDESLYVYTFATPRCMTGEAERACPGVFNIVGSFDPVTAVPFFEWGYNRYGNTLYLPAQELCADYAARKAAVEPVYLRMTGLHYWNNAQCNWLCCKVMQTLDEVMNRAGKYKDTLQQLIIDAMDLTGSLPGRLIRVFQMVNRNQPLKEMLADVMFNTDILYSAIAYSFFRQALGMEENLWNHGVSFAAELFHEHCPDVYVAWMFSQSEPEKLFIQDIAYHQLVLNGDLQVDITDEQGETLASPVTFWLGDTCLVTIPADKSYTVTLTAKKDTRIQLNLMERIAQNLYARVLVFTPTEGADLTAGAVLALTLPKGAGAETQEFSLAGTDQLSLTADTQSMDINSDFAAVEASNSGNTARGFLSFVLWACAILLALLILLLVYLIIRLCLHIRKKHRKLQTGQDKNNLS